MRRGERVCSGLKCEVAECCGWTGIGLLYGFTSPRRCLCALARGDNSKPLSQRGDSLPICCMMPSSAHAAQWVPDSRPSRDSATCGCRACACCRIGTIGCSSGGGGGGGGGGTAPVVVLPRCSRDDALPLLPVSVRFGEEVGAQAGGRQG